MQSKTPVEIADQYSRKRAVGVAAAAAVFAAVHMAARPFFAGGPDTAHYLNSRVMWAINAVALLLLLATGGGLLNSKRIRILVNDEVARSNYKTAVVAGYWVAMTTAMGLHVLPIFDSFSGRQAVFAIVTPSIVVALLTFACLEYRAHRDA
jgi:hypothetical protein